MNTHRSYFFNVCLHSFHNNFSVLSKKEGNSSELIMPVSLNKCAFIYSFKKTTSTLLPKTKNSH